MNALMKIIIVIFLTIGFGWLISTNSREIAGVPLIMIIFALNSLVQFCAFIPANIIKTGIFYNLTGSLTYLFAILILFHTQSESAIRDWIAFLLVLMWVLRLGTYLFYRDLAFVSYEDVFGGFMKDSTVFLYVWIMQGFWVTVTASPVFVFLSKASIINENLTLLEIVGIVIWIIGFLIEMIADTQKCMFKQNPANYGKFIKHGIWKYSRHPNYCGEIILWFGVSVFLISSLQGLELLTLISPIFVYLLLTKLSGLPIQEKKANKRWGSDPEYIKYKQQTPEMFPLISAKDKNE